jgi:hypothetical protein
MDNRINKIRKEISLLRSEMLEVEAVMHGQVAHDLDCTDASTRLMAMRAGMVALVRERRALGDRTPILATSLEVRKPRRR